MIRFVRPHPGRDAPQRQWLRGVSRLAAALSALALLVGCAPDTGAQRLTVTGSSTVAPLVAEIGKRFEAAHPGARVEVQTGGSSRGVLDARRGLADIGMASRALHADETDLQGHAIALDGIGLIVHADNPVAALDDDTVRALFTGAMADWSALGQPERAVVVVNKADGRSTLELFLSHFGLERTAVAADVVIGDNAQGIKTVAANAGAIGYVSIGAAQQAVADGTRIRLLGMAGVPATLEAVRSGRYPLSRPLMLVTVGPGSPLAQAFIEFARAPTHHDLVTGLSFVPLND